MQLTMSKLYHCAILLPLLLLLLYTHVIPSAEATEAIAAAARDDRQAVTGSRVRVLLVAASSNSSSKQQSAIEEANELSLDLPKRAPTQVNEDAGSKQPQDQISPTANLTSSPGYRQVSLASLTLFQRQQMQQQHQQDETAHQNGTTARATTTTTTTDEKTSDQSRPKPPAWSEMQLTRHLPSWLNVSSQFKINGSTIEEIEFLMPAQYLLRQAFDSPILLKTKLGILEGVRSIKFNKHLYTFLSVPYARPPIEGLRFRAPQPVEKWDGVLQATKWPPFCVQPSMTLASKSSPVHVLSQAMSEDCLYLNIWTPSLKFTRAHRRPVMVWIHGGAFQYGGSSVDENDGSALALSGDVVVVTFNYRISAFGFLNANNPSEAPNNVGLLDQQLALKWVHQNIKQFGGDPQQVTLFGESAGGHSVGLHMISPESQPLFKRAILQSGVPISFLRSYDVNSDNKGSTTAEGVSSVMMAKRLKCYASNNDDITNYTNGTELATTTETTTTTSEESNSTLATTTTNEEAGNDVSSGGSEMDQPVLNNETIECMRKKSSLEILKAMGAPGNSGFFPTGNDAQGFFPNGPIMESFDLESLKIGPQKDYLIGTNTDEGTFMLHYGMPSLFPARDAPKVSSVADLKTAIQSEIERMAKLRSSSAGADEDQSSSSSASQFNKTKADIQSASGAQNGGAQAHLYKPLLRTSTSMLENFMPKSRLQANSNGTGEANSSAEVYSKEAEFGNNIGSLITDIIFLCPARQLARTLSEAGRNVYFYLYSHRSSLSQYHPWIGVTHHDEVEFVFGRPLRMADVYSGKDIEMSQRLIKTWSHFAYTGTMLNQFNVEWPKYGNEDNNYMVLNSNEASIGQRYHDRFCNVYDTVISVHLSDS